MEVIRLHIFGVKAKSFSLFSLWSQIQTICFADGLRLLPREILLLFLSGTIVVNLKNTFSNEPCPDISSFAKRGSFARHPRRPLQNAPFCPISVAGSNFNPRNTQCMDACPDGFPSGVVKIFAFLELEQKFAFLKNPAASCRESSTVRNSINFLIRSLTPQQTAGLALAVQFKGLPRSMKTADIRVAFAWFKELIQKGRTNTLFAYPTKNP